LGAIGDLCRRYDVAELSLFGSALREDFNQSSDVDFLVLFKGNDLGPWAGKLQHLEADLSTLLGRHADVVPKNELKWVVRDRVLSQAKIIYVAAQ
jgi:predicted nucleotidyltransferase